MHTYIHTYILTHTHAHAHTPGTYTFGNTITMVELDTKFATNGNKPDPQDAGTLANVCNKLQ